MPTQNPRLTVTLKPSTYARIQEVSRLTGNSQSSLIAEILENSEPIFDRLIQVLVAAETAKQQVRTQLVADMEVAQGRIESQLGLALDVMDGFAGDLLKGAEAVKRRSRRAPPAASPDTPSAASGFSGGVAGGVRRQRSTPLSNRGVRSTTNKQNQQLTIGRTGVGKGGSNGQV